MRASAFGDFVCVCVFVFVCVYISILFGGPTPRLVFVDRFFRVALFGVSFFFGWVRRSGERGACVSESASFCGGGRAHSLQRCTVGQNLIASSCSLRARPVSQRQTRLHRTRNLQREGSEEEPHASYSEGRGVFKASTGLAVRQASHGALGTSVDDRHQLFVELWLALSMSQPKMFFACPHPAAGHTDAADGGDAAGRGVVQRSQAVSGMTNLFGAVQRGPPGDDGLQWRAVADTYIEHPRRQSKTHSPAAQERSRRAIMAT